MRYTQTTLKKLEELFGELDYAVRYEKGNFQSGYCIVEQRRIAVVNRFFDTLTLQKGLPKLLIDGDHEPVTLFVDVVGNGAIVSPLHTGSTALNNGTILEFTFMVKLAELAH